MERQGAVNDVKPIRAGPYRDGNSLLDLARCRNTTAASPHDTLAPLTKPGMTVYDLKCDIFGAAGNASPYADHDPMADNS